MTNTPPKRIQIGNLLLQNNLITADQLNKALSEQATKGGKLGQTLVNLGYISEESFLSFLAEQLKIPYIDLRRYTLKPEIVQKLPEALARRFRCILLDEKPAEYLVGMADPQDLLAYDEISRYLQKSIQLALIRESDLLDAFNLMYRHTQEITNLAEELSQEVGQTNLDLMQEADVGASEAPVVKLIQTIMNEAVQVGASDIHIEPDKDCLRIRLRIDGVLQEQVMNETRIAPALTQRLKLMARLNIAEKRLPQDGRFSVKVKGQNIDIRISTLPTQYGESIVMRLLNNSAIAPKLEDLGLPEIILQKLNQFIKLPHGMLLVTGPTGSGKTTTLYSLLNKLNSSEKKIITVEDPVEYRMSRITQVQVNPNIDLDFARVLRTSLRQDPDIIMVGEIRDKETSTIALRAAITGHLVLATMHTNDAISSAVRLIDLGSEGYLVGSAIRAVLAQRLVRRICKYCKESYQLSELELEWLHRLKPNAANVKELQRGKGCSHCNNSGYKGRLGIYEYIEINAPMADALCRNNTSEFMHLAHEQHYQSLDQSGAEFVLEGITTIEEVWRVAVGSIE